MRGAAPPRRHRPANLQYRAPAAADGVGHTPCNRSAGGHFLPCGARHLTPPLPTKPCSGRKLLAMSEVSATEAQMAQASGLRGLHACLLWALPARHLDNSYTVASGWACPPQVKGLFDKWNAALLTGDPKKVVALYAPDGEARPVCAKGVPFGAALYIGCALCMRHAGRSLHCSRRTLRHAHSERHAPLHASRRTAAAPQNDKRPPLCPHACGAGVLIPTVSNGPSTGKDIEK